MKRTWAVIKKFVKELDVVLLLICICCSTIGIVCIYSLYEAGQIHSSRAVIVQGSCTAIGILFAIVISAFDYALLAKLWRVHLPIAVTLVVLTYFIGTGGLEGSDDIAWLSLGFTNFQPSELLKLSFIFTFSLHLSKVKEDINKLKPFLLLCLHGSIPTILIVLQGDLGSALVFFAIFVFMMFVAGLSMKWILVSFVSALAAAPFIWIFILDDYLQERIMIAWHPENFLTGLQRGLQQYQGRVALGSGQLVGRGLFSDNLYRVIVQESDFIFSYIGQVFGFVGTVGTLLLITVLCVKILVTSKLSKDTLGCFICIGVFSMFLFQSIINIGMVLCVIPVIGITLPFFSAGGTSVIVCYMAIGMVCSVYRHNRRDTMFD